MNHRQISSSLEVHPAYRPLVLLPRSYARNRPRCGAVGRVGGEIDPMDPMDPIARRGVLVGLLACTVTPAAAAAADAPSSALSVETYTDAIDGWRIDVPSAWTKGEGSLGDKKVDRFSNAAGAY